MQFELASEPGLTVAFAPTKGERPEWVVQKLTELGVDRIVPLISERSVIRWAGERGTGAVERLRRVAREAAAQSRRVWLPDVGAVTKFADLAGLGGRRIGRPGPAERGPAERRSPGGGRWSRRRMERRRTGRRSTHGWLRPERAPGRDGGGDGGGADGLPAHGYGGPSGRIHLMTDEGAWLSTKEAAARLGITLRSLYRFIDEGDLAAYKFGRVIRLKGDDVARYIESCRIRPGQLEHLYPPLKGGDTDG